MKGYLIALACLAATPAMAQADKPLATRDLDIEGVRAEVIESVRSGNQLTVRVRLRNVGDKDAKVKLVTGGQSYDAAYVSAKDTKYLLIKDTKGSVVATPADGGGWLEPHIKPKGTWNWWGKFAAPPMDVKSYTLYLKVGPPIDDVPIVDKP
jgi:hypothetical protein